MTYEGKQAARVTGRSLSSSRKHTGPGLSVEEGHQKLPTRNNGPVASLRSLYSFYQPPWVLLLTAHNCDLLQRIVLGQSELPSPDVWGLCPNSFCHHSELPKPVIDQGKAQETHSHVKLGQSLGHSVVSGIRVK